MSSIISNAELARRLDRTPDTLAAWRKSGKGPPFIRIGNRVFYREEDYETWLAARRADGQSSESEGV